MQLNKALINPVQIYWYLFPLFIRVSPVLYLSTCKFTTSDALLTLPIVLVSPMTFVVVLHWAGPQRTSSLTKVITNLQRLLEKLKHLMSQD